MYWFRRPPYLRWAAAGLLVAGALVLELRAPPTVLHPFARRDLPVGAVPTDEDLEWRVVPAELLPGVSLADGALAHPVPAGEPLLPSALPAGPALAIPDGWWALTIPLPALARPGVRVELVVIPFDPSGDPLVIPGLVLEPVVRDDPFQLSGPAGLVAVPGESAALVATAAAEGRVVVGLVGEG